MAEPERSYVARNAAARERLRVLVARLSDDELRRPLGDGWTVAAALAHLTFWDRRVVVLLDRWEREGPGPSPVDVEVINRALLPVWLALPGRAAAEAAVAAADEVDRRLELLPSHLIEAVLAEGSPVKPDRANHRAKHLDEIERALAG